MKKSIIFLLLLICASGLIGCDNGSMDYIIENKPNITGFIEEIHDDHIIISTVTAEGYPYGASFNVSVNIHNNDVIYGSLTIGDEVVVYYDGNIAESDMPQIDTVYAISLKVPANRNINNKS